MYYELLEESEARVLIRFTDTDTFTRERRLCYISDMNNTVLTRGRVAIYCASYPDFAYAPNAIDAPIMIFVPGLSFNSDAKRVSIPWLHWPFGRPVLKEALWLINGGANVLRTR